MSKLEMALMLCQSDELNMLLNMMVAHKSLYLEGEAETCSPAVRELNRLHRRD